MHEPSLVGAANPPGGTSSALIPPLQQEPDIPFNLGPNQVMPYVSCNFRIHYDSNSPGEVTVHASPIKTDEPLGPALSQGRERYFTFFEHDTSSFHLVAGPDGAKGHLEFMRPVEPRF